MRRDGVQKMKKNSNWSLKFAIVLMIGLLFSEMVTAMYLTESINLDCFYNVGNLHEVYSEYYRKPGIQWFYDSDTKRIWTEGENASCYIDVKSGQKSWNYLCLEIEDLSGNGQWQIQFLDQDNNLLYVLDQEIHDGSNILQLQEGEIYAINIVVKDPSSFSIKRIQFRERLQNIEWNQAPWIYVRVLVFYFLIIFLFYGLVRYYRGTKYPVHKKGIWIETLQKFYTRIWESAGKLFQGIPQMGKPGLRKLLFLASLLTVYFTLIRLGRGILIQRRQVALLAVCLILIALLSWEGTKKAVDWRNPLVSAWVVLWLMAIVSEFVVEKKVENAGIFMLGVMAPFYIAWNSMKKPERLIRDFLTALRWFYWGGSVFCLFFRAFEPGIRYSGIYGNMNFFAGYLATANIAFLVCLDENLGRKKLKNHVLVENVLGLVTIWGFLQLTESITSLAAYIVEWVVFFWKQFPNEKQAVYWKNLRKVLAVSICCVAIVGIFGKWCLSNVPKIWEIEFEGEEYQPVTGRSSLTLVAEASEQGSDTSTSNRLLQKLNTGEWDTLFTGRVAVWKAYIRNWNLFGHYGNQEVLNGNTMHAHNIFLQMMNDYGVFIAVPYLIVLYYSLKYGIMAVFHKRKAGMSLFCLLATVNYIVQGVAENVATPYVYISWLTYYIALGGMFSQPEEV